MFESGSFMIRKRYNIIKYKNKRDPDPQLGQG